MVALAAVEGCPAIQHGVAADSGYFFQIKRRTPNHKLPGGIIFYVDIPVAVRHRAGNTILLVVGRIERTRSGIGLGHARLVLHHVKGTVGGVGQEIDVYVAVLLLVSVDDEAGGLGIAVGGHHVSRAHGSGFRIDVAHQDAVALHAEVPSVGNANIYPVVVDGRGAGAGPAEIQRLNQVFHIQPPIRGQIVGIQVAGLVGPVNSPIIIGNVGPGGLSGGYRLHGVSGLFVDAAESSPVGYYEHVVFIAPRAVPVIGTQGTVSPDRHLFLRLAGGVLVGNRDAGEAAYGRGGEKSHIDVAVVITDGAFAPAALGIRVNPH